jgi:hypothetical protein
MAFVLQTGTALHETDDTFAFAMRGNDLVAIKKSNTGTNSTEVHILSAASNYQQFVLQTGTALHETDDTFAFAMRGNDLVAIKKQNTGTGTTELHVLSGASNYQQFNLQTDTPLHETDATWAFAVRDNEVVGIKKSNTSTHSTELHIFRIREYLFGLAKEEVAYSMSECIYGWDVAFYQAGTHVIARIQLNWDAGIPAATRTMLMNTWRTGIVTEWSNRFACCFDPCCMKRRNVTFDAQWANNNPHHVIRVRVGPGQSNSGLWDTLDTAAVAAHEFGHLIGFADEYASTTCPSRNPVSTGTVMDDNAGMVQRLIEPFCNRQNLRTSTP